jgi:hypothetical protein
MKYECVWVDPETGEPLIIMAMTEEEIKERQDLNVKNTATAARERVLEHLRTTNGHSVH